MITLQFIGQHDFLSRAIGWFSAGHLSHVDVVMPNGGLLGARSDHYRSRAGDTSLEVPAGVRIRPANYVGHPKTVVRFSIAATTDQEKTFYDFLSRQIGRPYDYEAILGFVFNRDWRETDSWICSELVMAALEKAKLIPELYLAANRISPVAAALAISMISTGLSVALQRTA